MARRKRHFGNIRRLPSGRRQARYTCPVTGQVITAPGTFATVADAEAWLAAQLTDRHRGEWTDPTAADTTLGAFAQGWLAGGVVGAKHPCGALYQGLIERFILRAAPGYDDATGLAYIPAQGLYVPPVPAVPSPQQVRESVDLLLWLVQDFTFVTEHDRAN